MGLPFLGCLESSRRESAGAKFERRSVYNSIKSKSYRIVQMNQVCMQIIIFQAALVDIAILGAAIMCTIFVGLLCKHKESGFAEQWHQSVESINFAVYKMKFNRNLTDVNLEIFLSKEIRNYVKLIAIGINFQNINMCVSKQFCNVHDICLV